MKTLPGDQARFKATLKGAVLGVSRVIRVKASLPLSESLRALMPLP
ncbi:MAG: hypothetical protein OEW33_16015 [Nitrospirota bacterium]|nr:hypothetical protein [Nitrospirota bacterium]MDH4362230.1 hypothetical protein [Nitrospirota bacterium]